MQEQATLSVGTVIQKQYIVEGLLSRSNSGATYLVRDQRARDVSRNLFVLFVLKEVVEPNKQARRRLLAEGKFLRRLHHPCLPRVRQVLKDNKNHRVYLLMDFIAGQDLETLRQQKDEKLFSWTEVMSIMAPIIAAVTYLHSQQPPVIHGDIKPANIIMPREDSGVVLVDFGMMKAYNPGSTIAASRHCYRAPEQNNGSIDVRTDIYALGATYYTLVTGKLPPDAHARLTHVGNKALDPLEPVNSLVPALPMKIGKAIEQAMSLDTQHRFSSVEQFWEALWLVLADHPAPVFDKPSVPKDPPAVPTPVPERAIGQTIEKPAPEPLPVVPVLESIKEQEHLDVMPVPESIEEQVDQDLEQPASVVPVLESIEEQEDLDSEQPPPVVPVPESVEEREDPDTTVRFPRLLSVVPVPESVEEQEDLESEQPLPKPPAGVKEQEGQEVYNLSPKPSGDVRAPISLRKLGVLFIVLALLIGLGIGASLISRARSHTAAYSDTPASHAASPASLSPSYPNLARLYTGTIYDIPAAVTTKISLTSIQQQQENVNGYFSMPGNNLFSEIPRSGPFQGTINTSKEIQFSLMDDTGQPTFAFNGVLQSDGNLAGTYCSLEVAAGKCSDYGLWSVSPKG